MGTPSRQIRSEVTSQGQLRLSLATVEAPDPAPHEVTVRIEAAPINPSDLGLLLGAADLATAKASGTADDPVVTADIPPGLLKGFAARFDQSLPVGNEGAGVVVATGDSDAARALAGKTVSVVGGETYSQYRTCPAGMCMALPEGTKPEVGASWFVNPFTALGMVETMRNEGHSGLVHTAAASNLGQMLVKLCLADDVPLVNVVRKPEQAETLRALGAKHVVDSSAPGFREDLIAALEATGATLAFDAVGGGRLASQILGCMETAQSRGASYSRYGSDTHKQVYIYGRLDTSPTELVANAGFAWGIGGWLLTPFLQKTAPERMAELRARVASELETTFASHYTQRVSLAGALDLEAIRGYERKATGEKYLIEPNRGA